MMNAFLAIGRIGKDAQLTRTKNGAMLTFSIAVDRPRKGAQTDWIPCQVFGERAETLAPHMTKGVLIGVTGRIETWKRTLPDNATDITSWAVNVQDVNFLRSPRDIPESALMS